MIKQNIILLTFILLVLSCSTQNKIKSKSFRTTSERVAVLKKYFNLKSEIIDTHFEIYDVNLDNRTIPGATDRDYKIIVKVNKNDLNKWKEPGIITSFPLNYKWALNLLKQDQVMDFHISENKMSYSDGVKQMIIFEDTGVIFIRIVQK